MPNLTDPAIRAAKPGTTLWDSTLKGFGCRVLASGTKTFIVLIASGRRQSIGRYGPQRPGITLAEARDAARRILAEKTLGKIRPKYTAFEDPRDAFLKECETRLRPLTVKLYRRHLTVHYGFGRKSLGDISPAEIVRNLNQLNTRPSEKEHAYRIGRTFFAWCVSQHLIDRSPMEKTQRPPVGQARDRILSDDELQAVYKAARGGKTPFHHLVALLVLLGLRRTEAATLQWSFFKDGILTIPGALTKNRRPLAIPYGQTVSQVLAQIPRVSDVYLFPAARGHVKGKPTSPVMMGFSERKRDFDEKCGVTGWTLHDLRRTFATGLQKLGVRLEVIETLLNHVSGTRAGIVGVYQRYDYMAEMREAVEKWETRLASL